MAALDFPASPTIDQVYNATNGAAYQWDGEVWKIATDTGSPIVISADPPASPVVGQLWWRNDPDGSMFVYYDDGSSKQFVPAVSYTGGPSGPAGGSLRGTYPNPTLAAGLQSYARVRRTTSISIPNNTATAIGFDEINTNIGGLFSLAAADRFTIIDAGFYIFGGHIGYEPSGVGVRRAQMSVNGSLASISDLPGGRWNGTAWTSDYGRPTVSTGALLSPGTYVQLVALQDSGAPLTASVTVTASMWIVRVS